MTKVKATVHEQATIPFPVAKLQRLCDRPQLVASEAKLLAINAAPHGSGPLPIAVGAAHMHLPAKAPRRAWRLDFHENKCGTVRRADQGRWAWRPCRKRR